MGPKNKKLSKRQNTQVNQSHQIKNSKIFENYMISSFSYSHQYSWKVLKGAFLLKNPQIRKKKVESFLQNFIGKNRRFTHNKII